MKTDHSIFAVPGADEYEVDFWHFHQREELPVYPFCAESSKRTNPRRINRIRQPFLMIACLRSGALRYIFQDHKLVLKPDAILLIPPRTLYYFESYSTGGEYHKEVLEVKGTLLANFLSALGLDRVIHCEHTEVADFRAAFERIAAINRGGRDEDIPEAVAVIMRLLHQFSQRMRRRDDHERSVLMTSAIKMIESHLNIPVDLNLLCEKLSISRSTLGRSFRDFAGLSPRQYWIQRKIETAEYWLLNTDFSVKEIAFRLGYSSQFHFSNEFRRHTGHSPSIYRRRGLF